MLLLLTDASGCTKLLAYLSSTIASWDSVNDWLRDDLVPRFYRGGLQHRALVTTPNSEEAESNQCAAERFALENSNISPTL